MAKEVDAKASWASWFGFAPQIVKVDDIDGAPRSGTQDSAASLLVSMAADSIVDIVIDLEDVLKQRLVDGNVGGFYVQYIPTNPQIRFVSAYFGTLAGRKVVHMYWANVGSGTESESAEINAILGWK